MRVAFIIDGNPTGKARPRTDFVTGRVHEDAENAKIERSIRAIAAKAYGARDPLTGPVRVTILAVKPLPASWPKRYQAALDNGAIVYDDGKPDGDNIEKLAWDACSGLLWRDDSQVAEWCGRKRYGSPARTEVIVETIVDAMGAPPLPTPAQLNREKESWADVVARKAAAKKARKEAAALRRQEAALAGGGNARNPFGRRRK